MATSKQEDLSKILRGFGFIGDGEMEGRFSPLWKDEGYPLIIELFIKVHSPLPDQGSEEIDQLLLSLGKAVTPFSFVLEGLDGATFFAPFACVDVHVSVRDFLDLTARRSLC